VVDIAKGRICQSCGNEDEAVSGRDNIPIPFAWSGDATPPMNCIYDPSVYANIVLDIQYVAPVAGTEPFLKTLAPELFTNPLVYPTPDSFKQMHDVVLSSAEDDHKWSTLFTAAMGH
jgi:hypothetical protein